MKVTASLNELYVPEWNGNRKLPEADQITAEIIWPTGEEIETLVGTKMSIAEGQKSEGEVRVWFNVGKILRDHVGKITNLDIMEGGKAKKIKSGAELADCREPKLRGLVDEFRVLVTKRADMEEEAAKN